MHFFITGTDTGVGKTWFTGWLARAWLRAGYNAAALKPIATGDRDDALCLQEALGSRLTLDEINPVYFREAAAPLFAAQTENRTIDLRSLNDGVASMRKRFSHLAGEGVGGWRVPLAEGYEIRDWARELHLPVVVVARGTLGTLNHTLLTVESITAAGLTCAGVVLNIGPSPSPDLDFVLRRNATLLRSLLGLPVFEFDRGVETAGHVPLWFGGK